MRVVACRFFEFWDPGPEKREETAEAFAWMLVDAFGEAEVTGWSVRIREPGGPGYWLDVTEDDLVFETATGTYWLHLGASD